MLESMAKSLSSGSDSNLNQIMIYQEAISYFIKKNS